MQFLIDENLPKSLGDIFQERGFSVLHVRSIPELRGKDDELIFDYCTKNDCVLLTRDTDFSHPVKFDHASIIGIITVRFPNEISIERLIESIGNLTKNLSEEDYRALITLTSNIIRKRKIR